MTCKEGIGLNFGFCLKEMKDLELEWHERRQWMKERRKENEKEEERWWDRWLVLVSLMHYRYNRHFSTVQLRNTNFKYFKCFNFGFPTDHMFREKWVLGCYTYSQTLGWPWINSKPHHHHSCKNLVSQVKFWKPTPQSKAPVTVQNPFWPTVD